MNKNNLFKLMLSLTLGVSSLPYATLASAHGDAEEHAKEQATSTTPDTTTINSSTQDLDIPVLLDGKPMSFSKKPFLSSDRVWVPARELFESFGYKVTWNARNSEIQLTAPGGEQVILNETTGSLILNGAPLMLSLNRITLKFDQDRAMVPLRYASTILGTDIEWDQAKHTVRLSSDRIKLFQAILAGNSQVVTYLLKQGIKPDGTVLGRTAMQAAIYASQVGIAKTLLENGVDPNATGEFNFPVFNYVASKPDPEMMELLLQHGADPNQIADGFPSPLELAVHAPNSEALRLLLAAHADPNKYVQNENGSNPLLRAVADGNLEGLSALLDAGADLSATGPATNLLIDAVTAGRTSIVKALLTHGADPNVAAQGWSPLMIAAEQGNAEVVQLLLEHKAQVDVKNTGGATALTIALAHGNSETAALLQAAGAHGEGNANLPQEAIYRYTPLSQDLQLTELTPLLQAAADAHVEKIRELLASDAYFADKKRADELGHALIYAVWSRNIEAVKLLVTAGADPNQFPSTHLLNNAYTIGNEPLFRLLLEHGARVDVPLDDGQTLLMVTSRDNPVWLEDLLRHGANPNQQDENGITPLMTAAASGNARTIEKLLAAGADANLTTPTEDTALDKCIQNGNLEAMHTLLATPLSPETRGHALLTAIKRGSLESVSALLRVGVDIGFPGADGKIAVQLAEEKGDADILHALRTIEPQKE